ncbi:hypothetical protein OKW23_001496, partial [Bacilli bacterium PM5-9]|nr:hypothetical protein [Bacilli bacterium PM5-9]
AIEATSLKISSQYKDNMKDRSVVMMMKLHFQLKKIKNDLKLHFQK